SVLGGLFDGRRHFVGFAVAPGYVPALIADDHQGVEAEPPPALDHRRAAPDLHDPFFQPVLPCFPISRHDRFLFHLQVAFWQVASPRQNWSPPSRAPSASALTRPW